MRRKIRRCRRFIKKVAVSVGLTPGVTKFQVVQERTGNRKHPTKVTRVMDGNGKLLRRTSMEICRREHSAAGDGAGDCGSE